MNDTDLQAVRDFILRALHRYPRGISADILRTACNVAGLPVQEQGADSIDAHLLYLENNGLARRMPKRHTSSLEIWSLTAAGDDYLRGAKLI